MSTWEITRAALSKLSEPFTGIMVLSLIWCIWHCFSVRFKNLRSNMVLAVLLVIYLASLPIFSPLTRPGSDYKILPTDINVPIDYVVVLGCGNLGDTTLPISNQLSHCSLRRLVEGIAQQRLHPESDLVFTGGAGFFSITNAEVMANVAASLGVDPAIVHLEPTGNTTLQEVSALTPLLTNKNIILVTNASHMLRAIAYLINTQQRSRLPLL